MKELEKAGLLIRKNETISRKMYHKLIALDAQGRLTARAYVGEIGYMTLLRFNPTEVICTLVSRPTVLDIVICDMGQPGSAKVLNDLNNVEFTSIHKFIMKGGSNA
jgi:hypothetical protein